MLVDVSGCCHPKLRWGLLTSTGALRQAGGRTLAAAPQQDSGFVKDVSSLRNVLLRTFQSTGIEIG